MNTFKMLCVWHIITSWWICYYSCVCVCGFLLIWEKMHPFAGWLYIVWNLGRTWDWGEGYGIKDNCVILSLSITLGILKYPFLGELDVLRELAPASHQSEGQIELTWGPCGCLGSYCTGYCTHRRPDSMKPLGMDWQFLMTIHWWTLWHYWPANDS